jgi:hypothetical protein
LRGETDSFAAWLKQHDARRTAVYLVVILAGSGLFGAAMGCWRSPLQAVYTAVKFPLVILCITFGNALLNGLLAPLLGVDLRVRESLLAILASFTIAAAILGALSPIVGFLVWNAPPLSMDTRAASTTFSFIQVTTVAMIAFAGVAANVRLFDGLRRIGGTDSAARKVLLAWLAGNLFFGSQLCWILRPFFGSPQLPVEFLRPNAFEGNFYETVFNAMWTLFFT